MTRAYATRSVSQGFPLIALTTLVASLSLVFIFTIQSEGQGNLATSTPLVAQRGVSVPVKCGSFSPKTFGRATEMYGRPMERFGAMSPGIHGNPGVKGGSATMRARRGLSVNAEIKPAVIIGTGRVGQALKEMGSGDDILLGRKDEWPASAPEGPIFVATRNNDLDDVIEKVPENRREDLVFMQNGMLQPYLEKKGLENATQVLVYFAVAKLGDKPTDGITDMNPEGLTAAHGKWAQAAADRFHNAELSCKVLDKKPFEAAMFEKLIWICSFMLVGARHPGATVGDVESKYTEEVTNLIDELASAVPGVEFEPKLAERLLAYARSVSHFPTAVKEFEWRNGYFNELSKKAYMSASSTDPCPTHSAYLAEIGVGKVIPFPFEGYKEHVTDEEIREQDEILSIFEAKREEENRKKMEKKKQMEEKRKMEREKAESVRQEREVHEEQTTKARQLEMAKTAAEEETKRSRRKAGAGSGSSPL